MLDSSVERDPPSGFRAPTRRVGSLIIAIAVIACIWLIVLPKIGNHPTVSEHITNQQRLGINPSALFYTELQIAPAIADHVERLHDSYSEKFWRASPVAEPHETHAAVQFAR